MGLQLEVKLQTNDACWCGSGHKYKRCHAPSRERVRPATLSARRQVPEAIERPDYVETGVPRREEALVKDEETLDRMRRAGRTAAEVLAIGLAAVAPGVTTDEIDELVHVACLERGAYPSPLGYRGYPKSVCTSVNEVVCHGIPDSRRLRDGDIVNVDVTVYLDGVHGDTSATVGVGEIDEESARLVSVARECLARGIAAVGPGRPVSEIGRAIDACAAAAGFGVVRDFVGHGIGAVFHNTLAVPHYFSPAATTLMKEGMTFTIEPMLNTGVYATRLWEDGWTAVTADGGRSAQLEHTLVVTAGGAEVLTARDG